MIDYWILFFGVLGVLCTLGFFAVLAPALWTGYVQWSRMRRLRKQRRYLRTTIMRMR